jgi:hypothetical protein
MDDALKENVESFVHGLHNADAQLARLVDHLERDGAPPTVLLFLGDHQPTLGPDFALHRYTGAIPGEGKRRPEDFPALLTTQFIIWSNYKNDNTYYEAVGQNYMGNILLNYLDFPKPLFYYFLDEVYAKHFKFISRSEMYLDGENSFGEGVTMTERQKRVLGIYRALQRCILDFSDPLGEMLRELY